ncbi:MAG: hypothetical protein ACOZQL_10815 [Myxococcota bacterium]
MSVFTNPPYSHFDGVRVVVRPELLSRSTAWIQGVDGAGRPMVIVYSLTAVGLALAGVNWHDDPDHCRTWADGCRCDLGSES